MLFGKHHIKVSEGWWYLASMRPPLSSSKTGHVDLVSSVLRVSIGRSTAHIYKPVSVPKPIHLRYLTEPRALSQPKIRSRWILQPSSPEDLAVAAVKVLGVHYMNLPPDVTWEELKTLTPSFPVRPALGSALRGNMWVTVVSGDFPGVYEDVCVNQCFPPTIGY